MCVCAQSSLVPRSPMKKCQVPFDRYWNGLHVSSTSRPNVRIVISVIKNYTIFFSGFRNKSTLDESYTHWFNHMKFENRSMLTHTHTSRLNAPGNCYPLKRKKFYVNVFWLLHFLFYLSYFAWTKWEHIEASVHQTKENSNRIDLPYRGHFTMIYVEDNVNKTKRAREPINIKKHNIDILLLLLVLMLFEGS